MLEFIEFMQYQAPIFLALLGYITILFVVISRAVLSDEIGKLKKQLSQIQQQQVIALEHLQLQYQEQPSQPHPTMDSQESRWAR